VLVTVGFAVLIFGMVATMSPVFGDEGPHRAGAEVVVAPAGTPGLSDAAAAAVPGATTWTLTSTVYVSSPAGEPAALAAAGAGPGGPGPDELVTTAGTAARFGWEVGGTVAVTFADGRTEPVRVAGLTGDGGTPGPLLLDRDTVRAHDPSALAGAVYVRGVDAATVDRAVAGLGAIAVDAATYAATDDEDRLVWIFALIMIGMSVGYTGIAVANTLMMATGERRRDFRVLRMSGATAGQVRRMVAAEAVLVVGLGTGLGFAVSLPALLGIRSALAEEVGRPVALLLPWPQILAVVGACALLALAASLTAAWLALRSRMTQVELSSG
jgi:putative ABC transport system permease protein